VPRKKNKEISGASCACNGDKIRKVLGNENLRAAMGGKIRQKRPKFYQEKGLTGETKLKGMGKKKKGKAVPRELTKESVKMGPT